jgi:exopolysaccharide production protein ExoZ
MNTATTANLRDFYIRTLARPIQKKDELLSVQRVRGIAVLMVLIVHIEDVSRHFVGSSSVASLYSRHLGYSAADLFFVISGFIMAYITFTRPFDARSWAISRFIRIYPMYVLFSLLVVGLWLYNPRMTMGSGEQNWGRIAMSLMGLPQANLPLLFVGWTVEHEILFYTIVFLTAHFLGRDRLPAVMVFLSCLAVGRWLLKVSTGIEIWDYHLASPYMVQFTMGVLIYKWWKQLATLGWQLPAVLGSLFLCAGMVFATSGTINNEPIFRIFLFGFAYSCFFVCALNLESEQRKSGKFRQHRDVLVWVGDASYSIYLSHAFVLGSFGKIFPFVGESLIAQAFAVIAAGVSVMIVGLLTHVLIERRVMEFGHRLSKNKRRVIS